jgi:hypothetical protein
MGYVLAILEEIPIPSFLPHNGMVCIETGMEGTSEKTTAIINENRVVALDSKLAAGILKNWELFANSPEYPFIQYIKRSQEKS